MQSALESGAKAGAEYGTQNLRGQQETQLAKLKSYLEGEAYKQKQSQDLETLQKMKDQGLVPGGGSARVGELSSGADPYVHMLQRQQSMEANQGKQLYQTAQKQVTPIEQQLQAMSTMHQLLDDPNSVDQKQMGVLQARLAEGPGQRLLQSVVKSLGAPDSVSGDVNKASNYLFGQAKSGFTADQSNAMRQNLFKRQSEVEAAYSDGKDQFMKGAPMLAPQLGPDKVQQAIGAATIHSDNLLKGLHSRQQAFESQQGSQVVPQNLPPQQATPSSGSPSVLQRLGNFLRPQGAIQPPQPQAAPQQAPQKPLNSVGAMNSTPNQSPSTGNATIRVRHKATGQTGTLPSQEFDPSVYDKVQ